MSDVLWLAGSAAAGIAVGVWWYGVREERVAGRLPAALLRAGAVTLLLAALRLPPLPARGGPGSGTLTLLDVSRSMTLPARPGGPTRIDSARALLRSLPRTEVLLFGGEPVSVAAESALAHVPGAETSRLAPALVAAAARGAGRVRVVGDGEWDDPAEAAREAERLGLGVEEQRVAVPVSRVGLVALELPARAVAGDTVEATVELTAAGDGALPDSVRVVLTADEDTVAWGRAPVPSPGRRGRLTLRFLPRQPAAESEWQGYEAALAADADPFGVARGRQGWMEVAREARGAVLVALDPDWEPRFLLPALERAVAGGARAYLRVSPDRFVRVAIRPAPTRAEAVRQDARSADLLILQGTPPQLAGWAAEARGAERLLLLPRGAGPLPGTPVAVEGGLAGDWYPSAPAPPSPISGYLAAVDPAALPPPGGLLELSGSGWTPLELRRDRRGAARPLLLAGGSGERRWAALAATGTWRWALREGTPRQAYRALFAALAGWLLEARRGIPVALEEEPRAGAPLRWRVAPGVRELALSVYDSTGSVVWRDTLAGGVGRVTGPVPPPGPSRFEAEGSGPDDRFRVERPFHVHPGDEEWLPRAPVPPLATGRGGGGGERRPEPRRRAVWPFAAAVLLLCVEWAWRRRIGLR